MNSNIEKINEHTLAVNYGLVIAGLVYGINMIDNSKMADRDIVSLSADGFIILNNQSEFYPLGVFMFPIIQLDNDFEFNRKVKYIDRKLKANTASDYEKVYALFLSWEGKRRELFIKSKRKRRWK